MERNLRVIPLHHALAHALAWLPVFVLFTRGHFGLDGALTLAATYYLAAVSLDVPSGWFSDRVGRVATLRIAGIAWIGAHAIFLTVGDQFVAVVIGQCLMAAGFSALSGTDVALHYDSLEALGREEEYEDRQGRVSSAGYIAGTIGTILGGALGLVDLRLAFGASLAIAAVQFLSTFWLTEPPAFSEAGSFHHQLRDCVALMWSRIDGRRLLGWIFIYWIAMVVLEHVAFTLSQPYLTEALGRSTEDLGATPMVVGLQFAASSAVGALAARLAPRVRRRLGLPMTLMLLAALSAVIVSVMGAVIHGAVIALLVMRSVHGAAAPVLMTAAAAPLVEARRRATYFSIHSLAGRLTYSSVLFVVAAAVGDDLTSSLRALAVVAWVSVLVVGVTFVAMGRPRPVADQPSYNS